MGVDVGWAVGVGVGVFGVGVGVKVGVSSGVSLGVGVGDLSLVGEVFGVDLFVLTKIFELVFELFELFSAKLTNVLSARHER